MRGRRGGRFIGAAGVCLVAAGCTRVGAAPELPAPEPVPVPVVDVVRTPAAADEAPAVSAPPDAVEGATDPILHSRFARHPVIGERVAAWIERYTVRDGHAFPQFLERMSAYEALVDSALVAEGLPRSLRYVPIIESGYVPSATSPVSAVGLWQFMAPVARSFGMHVSSLVDERRDPVKSTLGAARYLRELDERFGSWFLALAAYNSGPNRVDRLIREHAPLAPLGDSLYTVIFPHLPAETRDFVPKLIAVASVAERPEAFGIEAPSVPARAYAFEEVELPDATSFDVVAEAAGVDEDEIRRLNPHIVRGLTPRGRPTAVRLPPGTRDRFEEAYAEIPPDRRVTVTEHVVSSGETLGGIARQYGVRTADLQAANPGVRPRRMRIGTRLLVPREGGAATGSPAGPSPADGHHVVRSGESLWIIARRYGRSVRELQNWNGLREGSVLQPGDRIRVAG
jgi:membrane-bound lytic murein transglycosylase D